MCHYRRLRRTRERGGKLADTAAAPTEPQSQTLVPNSGHDSASSWASACTVSLAVAPSCAAVRA
jgi:hypothetical protein